MDAVQRSGRRRRLGGEEEQLPLARQGCKLLQVPDRGEQTLRIVLEEAEAGIAVSAQQAPYAEDSAFAVIVVGIQPSLRGILLCDAANWAAATLGLPQLVFPCADFLGPGKSDPFQFGAMERQAFDAGRRGDGELIDGQFPLAEPAGALTQPHRHVGCPVDVPATEMHPAPAASLNRRVAVLYGTRTAKRRWRPVVCCPVTPLAEVVLSAKAVSRPLGVAAVHAARASLAVDPAPVVLAAHAARLGGVFAAVFRARAHAVPVSLALHDQRVAVPQPSGVMRGAVAESFLRTVAAFNRTGLSGLRWPMSAPDRLGLRVSVPAPAVPVPMAPSAREHLIVAAFNAARSLSHGAVNRLTGFGARGPGASNRYRGFLMSPILSHSGHWPAISPRMGAVWPQR